MNIIINQKKLLEAIHTVEHVVSKNISLPILTTILLRAEGGKLKLTATNLEIGIQVWVGARVEKEGVVAVPARIFSDFVSSVQDEKLTITSEQNSIFLTSENYKTQILGMVPDEFPLIPIVAHAQKVAFPGVELGKALASVVDAASLLETRPELSGVYIHIAAKQATFAATDSFRLSEYILPGNYPVEKSCILPRITALEILRLATGRQETVHLNIGENQVGFGGNEVELVSRLIDGRYPDYKKVIPERSVAEFTVEKQILEQHVRMAGIFSSSISDLVLKLASGALHVMAKNSDRGEIASKIPVSSKAAFSVSVNYRYLLDALKVIQQQEVEVVHTGEGSPLIIRGKGNTQHTYVIMPLRA